MHRKCGTALPARPLDLKLALFLNLHSDLCRYAAQEHCYVATATAVNAERDKVHPELWRRQFIEQIGGARTEPNCNLGAMAAFSARCDSCPAPPGGSIYLAAVRPDVGFIDFYL